MLDNSIECLDKLRAVYAKIMGEHQANFVDEHGAESQYKQYEVQFIAYACRFSAKAVAGSSDDESGSADVSGRSSVLQNLAKTVKFATPAKPQQTDYTFRFPLELDVGNLSQAWEDSYSVTYSVQDLRQFAEGAGEHGAKLLLSLKKSDAVEAVKEWFQEQAADSFTKWLRVQLRENAMSRGMLFANRDREKTR